MNKTPETSVLFALAELQRTEVARQSEEAANLARVHKEQQERERSERERAREQELQAQRTAEAAARLRVQVEAREAAARERVLQMQQSLARLKAERDVLQEHLQAQQQAAPVPAQPAAVRWAMSGMALSLIAVAAMALVMLLPPARTRAQQVALAVVSATSTPAVVAPAAVVVPALPAPAGPAVAAASPLKHPRSGAHPAAARPPASTGPDLRACADDPDPLCGLKFTATTVKK